MPLTRGRSIRFGGDLHRDSNEAAPSGAASYFVRDPSSAARSSSRNQPATPTRSWRRRRRGVGSDDRRMTDERRIQRPAPPAGQPDTREEVDPDVAELLGLRPVDAGDW